MSMNVARPQSKMGNRNDQRGGGYRGPPNRNQQNRNQGGGGGVKQEVQSPRNQKPNREPNKPSGGSGQDNRGNGMPQNRGRGAGGGDRSSAAKPDDTKRDAKDRDQPQESKDMETDGQEGAGTKRVEKKFTQRCRLFVGNLTPDTTEDEFKELFRKYGEVSEVFLNKAKGFGFIRLVSFMMKKILKE